MTAVAAALILDKDNRILMTYRSPRGSFPSMWELPGGKVERGETPRVAVAREIKEELGCTVSVGQWVGEVSFAAERHYTIDIHECTIVEGTPAPLVAAGLRWITLQDAIRKLPLVPSTYLGYWKIAGWIEQARGVPAREP